MSQSNSDCVRSLSSMNEEKAHKIDSKFQHEVFQYAYSRKRNSSANRLVDDVIIKESPEMV